MGRHAIPTAVKQLEGDRGHRGLNEHEPQPPKGAECPAHLEGRTRDMWLSLAGHLERLELLTVVDAAALEGACVAYVRATDADQQLTAEGFISEGTNKNGSTYQMTHPAVAISKTCWKQYLEFCREFGLTPSSRSGLQVASAKKKSDGILNNDWMPEPAQVN